MVEVLATEQRVPRPSSRGIEKRFLLNREEDRLLESMLFELREASSVAITSSHYVRAFVRLMDHHRVALTKVVAKNGLPPRPANGDEEATQAFENQLSKCMLEALTGTDADH